MNPSLLLSALTAAVLACASIPSLAQANANSQVSSQSAQQEFALGSQAFKAGNYAQALIHFDKAQAQSQGPVSATLSYNRAVSYYKLGRYDEAKADFNALIPTDSQATLTQEQRQWADLGRYNLGLIARDQGQYAKAQHWFSQLQQADTNARLKELSQRQLQALPSQQQASNTEASSPTGGKKSAALVSLGLVVDDNASGLADELSSELSQSRDHYLNLLAYGQHYVSGQRNQGTKVYGLAQVRRYQEFESFDSSVFGVGLGREFSQAKWHYELGGRALQTQLNGSRLSNQYTFNSRAQGQKDAYQGHWEFSYQGSFIDAGSNYEYIQGWQDQVRATRVQTLGKVTLTPSLGWEFNDRENRRTEQQFYSYSPEILSASLALRWDINRTWRLYSQFDWADASYSGTNRLTDLGKQPKAQQREYERSQLMLGARYRISPHWSLKGEYSSTSSDDNFALYSYDKNVFSLKLDYGW